MLISQQGMPLKMKKLFMLMMLKTEKPVDVFVRIALQN